MKKYATSMITLLLILTLFRSAFANSGPVFWQGYPAAEMISVEELTPLTVESEELIFDFSQQEYISYALEGKVTATYQMFNPTNEQQKVQMAFPFVGQLRTLSPSEIVIEADTQKVPYEIYLSEKAAAAELTVNEANTGFTFTEVLSAITKQQYKAKCFAAGEVGRLYRFDVSPTTKQEINFAVTLNCHAANTKILNNGFNGIARDAGKVRLTAWCTEPQQLEIFVLGDEPEFTMQAYSNGELTEPTDLFAAQLTSQEQQLKTYLLSLSQSHLTTETAALLEESQLYNLYAAALDHQFTNNLGFCAADELWAQTEQERIMVLVYTLDFPAQSSREVSVSYLTSGTMDKRETVSPQYTFTYLLNPAAHWSQFKDLQIKIITPPEAPYVVNSSLALQQLAAGQYSGYFAALPEQDLTFTLYAAEKITVVDKVAGKINHTFGYFTPLVLGALLLLVMIRLIVFFRKRALAKH